MPAHVKRTVSRCFAALRQLRQIRRAVPTATFQMFVVALVHTRLDYGNAVLVGMPAYLVRRLQSVLNAAARLLYHLRPHDHISDALATVHWLRVPERVQYKIAFKMLHDSSPRYLGLGPLVAVTDQPPRRTAHQAVYSWQPCLSGCHSSSLEFSARGRRLIVIIADFPPSIKNSSFSTFMSSPDFLTVWLASLQRSL